MVRKQCQCDDCTSSKCKCQVRHRGYRPLGPDNVVFTTRSFSFQRLLQHHNNKYPHRLYEVKEESETNIVEKTQITLKRFYDACAEYNSRYCSITGFMKNNRNYFKLAIKDVAILICFLATNFVVFIAIICKTIEHSFFLILMSLQWILRVFISHAGNARMGALDYSFWPSRTEELIRTLGLRDEYTTQYPLNKYTSVFTNT